MPDTIGGITVPEVAPVGTFPLIADWGFGHSRHPEVAVHRFGSANGKIEQRFLLGGGLTRYTFFRSSLNLADRLALEAFWEARQGPYGPFTYNVPDEDGGGTTATIVRFEQAPLSVNHLSDAICSAGVTFIEVPQSSPTYALNDTLERFPDAALETALLSQVQVPIPLIKITVKEAGYPAIYLSDRRCTVGAQLYQARLLRFDGISQAMNGESDDAQFVFGNADRVMRDLSHDTDLMRADVEFSIFHVGEGVKLDLWKGEVIDHAYDGGPEFHLSCSDSVFELTLSFPERVISDSCWKKFDDSVNCPWTTEGSGSFTECDKTWTDCQARGMSDYFGGITVKPQNVQIKETGTGLWGFGRKIVSRSSQVNESILGEPLAHVYTNTQFWPNMPVDCLIAAGRDEEDFYSALGIVGAGPIQAFSYDSLGHRLDGQVAHGPLPLGLRRSLGHDPAQANDPDPNSKEFSIGPAYSGERAAGVAFLEIRRSDEAGLQLSRITEHAMQAKVVMGLGGWIWDASGDRSFDAVLTNPVWIAVNALLRTSGLYFASEEAQEAIFDWASAYAASVICDTSVTKIDGSGSETQFLAAGVLRERRPLRDWLTDILTNCLGYWWQSWGKLKTGIRVNSSAVEAFTAGNIVAESLQFRSRRPVFNLLEANYKNSEQAWKADVMVYRDEDAAEAAGGGSLKWLPGQISLVLTPTPSQAARIAITRAREELGGITAAERLAARWVSLRTTILGLAVEPGMVCSVTHDDAPGGYIEFRVERWRLLPDWSIEIEGPSTTDSMYNYVIGPKPADVVPDPVPAERVEDILPIQPWFPHAEQPDAADPLFDETDWQFDLSQRFDVGADGIAVAKLRTSGLHPVTTLVTEGAPVVGVYSIDASGGSIPSDSTVTIVLVALDAEGRFSRPATPTAITVGSSGSPGAHKITLSSITWPSGTVGYRLYAGTTNGQISLQQEALASQPSSIDLTSIANVRTYGPPQPQIVTLRARAKIVEHAGVVGVAITEVTENTITCPGIAWTASEWVGRVASIITDETDGEARIWNFLITANDAENLTVTPDPYAAGVDANDVLIIRTKATAYSATTIGDAKFQNSQYPEGATPDEEIGRQVRIIAGTGIGQVKRIIGNDATTLTIEGEWDTTPNSTSIFVIEQPTWEYEADVRELVNSVVDGNIHFDLPVQNYLAKTLLVEIATVSSKGVEPKRIYNPWREIYLYGRLGGLRHAATFGIDGETESGVDLGPRRPIHTDEEGIPLLVRIVAKSVSSALTLDFDYSGDQGETWTSIFYAPDFRPTLDAGDDVEINLTGFDPDAYFEPGGWLRQSVISGAGEDIESVIEFGLPIGIEGQAAFQDEEQSGEIGALA